MTCAFSASTANSAVRSQTPTPSLPEASASRSATPSSLADYSGHLSNQTNPLPALSFRPVVGTIATTGRLRRGRRSWDSRLKRVTKSRGLDAKKD